MSEKNAHALLYCRACDEIVGCAHRDQIQGAMVYRHPNKKNCRHEVSTLEFRRVETGDPTPYAGPRK